MPNPTNEIVAVLEREWPRWQVWVVHRVVGRPGLVRAALDDHSQVLNADSATELAEQLEQVAVGDQD